MGYGWSQPLLCVPDLTVGLVWCAVGLSLWRVRPVVAYLALATGGTWFLATVLPVTVFWHRAPLVHLLLVVGFTSQARALSGIVALVYLASVVPAVWHGPLPTIGLACLLLAVTAGLGATPERTMPARAAQSCLAVTCLVLIVAAMTRLAVPDPSESALPTLLGYQATLAVVGVVMGAVVAATGPPSVADRVVELNNGPASSLRDALAEVLDDPTLEVGYWRGDRRLYTDLEGHPVVPPPLRSGRVGLPIHRAGQPVALVVHDAALQEDPRLAAAVGVATRLATANVELRRRVSERRQELAASRQRLVRAADEERADLASWLRVGPQARLSRLLATLRGIHDAPSEVTGAATHLARALEDLDRWEMGLYPRDLERGLEPALQALAGASQLPVTVTVRGPRVQPALEAAIYYVCAEALANVTKHSEASRDRFPPRPLPSRPRHRSPRRRSSKHRRRP